MPFKVGHICKEKKKEIVVRNQKKQCQPKDKGNENMVEPKPMQEGWNKPKKTNVATIHVGHLQIPIGTGFQDLD